MHTSADDTGMMGSGMMGGGMGYGGPGGDPSGAAGVFGYGNPSSGMNAGGGFGGFGSPSALRGQMPMTGGGMGMGMHAMHVGSPSAMPYASGMYGHGSGMADAQRRWDMTQLMSKLTDMQLQVAAADESLATKGLAAMDAGGMGMGMMDGTGGAPGMDAAAAMGMDESDLAMAMDLRNHVIGFDGAGMPVFRDLLIPDINPADLPVYQGDLMAKYTKRGTLMASRAWRHVFARIEGAELVLYASVGAADEGKAELRYALDASTEVVEGSRDKKHKNVNVKFDFDIRNESGEPLSLYADALEVSQAWIMSVQYIVRKVRDAAWRSQLRPEDLAKLVEIGQAAAEGTLTGEQAAGMAHMPDAAHRHGPPPEVAQALADEAQCHTAFGPGLYEAVRGEPATFVIQANTAHGAPKDMGGDEFVVTLSSDDLHFDVAVADNGDGTYNVEYTPTRSGEYELRITYRDYDIFGSPFHPTVSKAPTSARNCVVSGDGVTVARPGVVNTFTIVARDKFDDERGEGGDNFEITVTGPGIALPILDQGDGTYTVRYEVDTEADVYRVAQSATRHIPLYLEVAISLVSDAFPYPRPVSGSPFAPRIVLPREDAPVLEDVGVAPSASRAAVPRPPASATRAQADETAAHHAADEYRRREADAELQRRMAEIEDRERKIQESAMAVEEARRRLEADRVDVDRQMTRMSELGKKVKEDSERLAEQARTLRAVAAAAAASPRPAPPAAPVPQPPSFAGPSFTRTPAPPAASRVGAPSEDSSLRASADAWRMQPAPVSPPTAGPALMQPAIAADAASVTTGLSFGTGAAMRAEASAAPDTLMSADAPAELFEPDVIGLFDKHKRPLFALWQFYTSLSRIPEGASDGRAPGIDAKRFVELYCDFDIAPTFLSKRELKAIFAGSARAHAGSLAPAVVSAAVAADGGDGTAIPLTYSGFIEALGRTALAALSKAAFQHLYPTALKKVGVLLELWGMADPEKLSEIARRPRAARDPSSRRGARRASPGDA